MKNKINRTVGTVERERERGSLNSKKKIRQEQGAITLYVLISMMFLLIVILGIYFSTSNKIQKQEKEIEKIQKEYEKNNINDIYEEAYNNYLNTETPTIQVYDGETKKSEVIGEKVSSRKTIYLANKNVRLKFLSKNTSDKYAYSTTANGEKIKIEGNILDIDITTSGKTIYVYIEDNNGNYSKNYTAVTMILVTLQDKTIYVEEGKSIEIGKIQGENAGKITFGQIEDSEIIKLDGEKIIGLKAGTTTLIATEEKAGATATITVKVVKIELESTSGTILIGESRTVKITGTNNGTLSVKTSDKEVAPVIINNNEIIITAKKEGDATITVAESNANAEVTYEIKVASVALEPNGGTYTIPTGGATATIKTTVTTVNADKIEVAWSDNAGNWVEIENNKLVSKTDCTKGTYYLYVKINGEAIYKSEEFIVGENTLAENKITITPSKTNWTNQNITATVTYGSTLTQNKKAGYGTTLANAQSAASTSTATSLTATANGYFYAEATDAAGNKITSSLQISNIDKEPPTIGSVTGSTEIGNTGTVTVTDIEDIGSGLKGIYINTDSTTPTETSVEWTPNTVNSYTKTVSANGTYYVWVIDKVGNVSAVKSCTVSGIVPRVTEVTLTNAIVKKGETVTIAKTLSGSTSYKTIAFTSSATATATIVSGTGVATGVAAGISTITCTVTNYDGTTVSGTCTLTVVDLSYSPNGGSYALPYTNDTAGTATIKSEVAISGATTSYYAWSTSKTTAPTSWSKYSAATGETPSTTSTTAATYYLWNKVVDASGNYVTYVSSAFTIAAGKIELTPSTTEWTNQNVTVTATWPSNITQSKTLTSTGTSGTDYTTNGTTSITVITNNQTVTAQGYDANKVNQSKATLKITNIDKALPTIGSVAGSTATGNTGTVTVSNIADTGGSGLKGIYISTSSTTPTATSVTWTPNTSSSYTKTVSANGTYYVWVLDNAGNVSAVKSCTVSGIVPKVTGVTLTNAIVKKGATVTIAQTLSGSTSYKTIAFTSSATAKATIVSGTGVATGVAAGTSTITCTVTNYDGTTVSGTCTLTVVDLSYSPNGGSYALPYTGNTSGTATIKSAVTISGATTSYYQWSTSKTTVPTSWLTYSAATGGTPSTTSTTAATYYLWNKVADASGNYITYVSNAFTITANKITITPSTTAWTNGNVTCTIAYPSVTTSSTRKASYGSTLTAATTASSSATAPTTSVTVSANGYVYAQATDAAGNKVTASLQITNIDKTNPSNITIETLEATTKTITILVSASDVAGTNEKSSGIKEYRFSSDNGNTWSNYQTSSCYSFQDLYKDFGATYNIKVEVKDNAGNTATGSKNINTSLNNEYIIESAGTELIRYNWDQSGTGKYIIFTKTNSGRAIAGICFINGWVAPVVVSTDVNAVSYCTTDSGNTVFTSYGNIEWGGTKYYYSSNQYWYVDTNTFSSKLKDINKKGEDFDSIASAASELLTKYYNNISSGYEVNYNINSEVDRITTKTYFDEGSIFVVISDKPKRTGYEFLGWSTSYNATSATYYSNSTYASNQSTTLYAIWKKHSYTSTVIKQAKCTENGIRKYTCSCGDSYEETINALGHSPGAAATCTNAQTCIRCSYVYQNALGHSGVRWVYNGAQTCYGYCTRCGGELYSHTTIRKGDRDANGVGRDYCTVCNTTLDTFTGW